MLAIFGACVIDYETTIYCSYDSQKSIPN